MLGSVKREHLSISILVFIADTGFGPTTILTSQPLMSQMKTDENIHLASSNQFSFITTRSILSDHRATKADGKTAVKRTGAPVVLRRRGHPLC
jgi:hypothetical protein